MALINGKMFLKSAAAAILLGGITYNYIGGDDCKQGMALDTVQHHPGISLQQAWEEADKYLNSPEGKQEKFVDSLFAAFIGAVLGSVYCAWRSNNTHSNEPS